jgi:hypothetical protein
MVHKKYKDKLRLSNMKPTKKLEINSPDCAYNKQSISVDICDIYIPIPSIK